MAEKFKIVEMKLEDGQWNVRFSGVPNFARFGSPSVTFEKEEFRGPEIGMHEFTPEEVIAKAHRAVANSLYFLFKTAVMSVPGVDWENVKSLTVSEILSELGIDDAS
jgi:hypothetical protein